MATQDDLDLIETQHLVDALTRRHDMIAIVGVVDKTSASGDMLLSLNGSRLALAKLLEMTASAMLEDAYDEIACNINAED